MKLRAHPAAALRPTRRQALIALASPLASNAAPPRRSLVVGPGERWRSLRAALAAAGNGDVIEMQPGIYRADVGVVEHSELTIRGLGRGAVLVAAGANAEGKAILVVRGGAVRCENLEFRGARVPDGNGAGIRFERGHLFLRDCRFYDNEMGLLSANDPALELEIVDCRFGEAPPYFRGQLHHLLYVGTIGRFALRGCFLGGGWLGHLLKSRAAQNRVFYNRFDEGLTGQASYEIEFPNGGDNVVVGNVVAQSPHTQNPAIVAMGAEAHDGMGGSLVMAHNTLVNRAGPSGVFLRVWDSRLAGQARVQLANNLFVGPGDADLTDSDDAGGNHRIDPGSLDPDYRLRPDSALLGSAVALGPQATPVAEFAPPAGTRALPPGLALAPGAMQRF